MKQQLIIIGNGFDLSCGLKSSYGDFYNKMIKNQYNGKSWGSSPQDFWHYLLCYYDNGSNDYNWCKIEEIIQDTLFEIKSKYLNIIIDNYVEIEAYEKYSKKEIVYDKLAVKDKNHYSELLILSYLYDFIKYSPKPTELLYNQNELLDEFFYHLLDELKKLENLFCQYLRSLINNQYIENAYKLFKKLYSGNNVYTDTIINELKTNGFFIYSSVLSFNYTMPLIDEPNDSRLVYNNVHGKLCDKDYNCNPCFYSNIILGLDDIITRETKEKHEPSILRIFSKTYRTLFLTNKFQARVLPFRKSEKIVIKFFGHSLAPADYSYFQSIFDYYDIYDNEKIHLEFYYKNFKSGVKKEITDAVYNLINEYGATFTNINCGKNLIHKLILEKRIRIKELE